VISIFLRRLCRATEGVTALEFAILGPILLTFMLGAIDMGRMLYVRQGLEYSTQEAARYYMLNPTSTTTAVTTYLRGKMVGGLGNSVSVAYTDTASCNGNATVTCTMISATYNFSFVASYLGLGNKTLQAKAQAVRY
jgi:Flp pilus assembly protein TadG